MPDQYDERARALRGLLTTAISGGFPESKRPEIIEATIQAVFAYARAVAAEARASERETCARDVCMYCDRRARRYGPAAGPNPAGNYVHQHDETGRIVLCYASAIRSRHARISANAAKEE